MTVLWLMMFDDGVGDEAPFVISEAAKLDAGDGKSGDNGSGANASTSDTTASVKGSPAASKASQASVKTGDAIPMVAVCILALAGLAIALIARRKMNNG